jgi:hypothetical protein
MKNGFPEFLMDGYAVYQDLGLVTGINIPINGSGLVLNIGILFNSCQDTLNEIRAVNI